MEWKLHSSLFSVDELYDAVYRYCQANHCEQALCALPFMKECHKEQFRKKSWFAKEQVPYIVHPLTMAKHAICLGITKDEILAAILLHDVCEDCGIKANALPVNERTKSLVTKLTFQCLDKADKKHEKAQYIDRLSEDKEAAIIKLFDRCNNVSTMATSFSKEKMIEYVNETEQHVYPLLIHLLETAPEWKETLFVLQYHMMSNVETIKNLLSKEYR